MPDPLFGKAWNMSATRSRFSTSKFVPIKETRLYEEVPGGYKLTVTGSSDGKEYSWNYTALYDGKPHPVYGRPDVNQITIYRVNDLITVGLFAKDGVAGGPYARSVSQDGRTLTVQAAGRNVDGSPFFDVIEYQH